MKHFLCVPKMGAECHEIQCFGEQQSFLDETYQGICVLTKYLSAGNISPSSKAARYPLKSWKMALIRWELSRLRHPAYKKCCDWKPGKLMSLHFYLLNLYRLLCQGLWGFSVPSLVIVFSLFAWESGTFFMKLRGNPSPHFFTWERQAGRRNLCELWILLQWN